MESQVLQGDCLDVLKTLPEKSIDCCVTSPPYYGLRDYGTGEWIGGDPNCPHRRTTKRSDKTITGHAQKELESNVGDAIYKTICPKCGAIRVDKQIGLEETPEEYIEKLVNVFREVKRVLKDDGTLWVNIGDSYAGGQGRWGGNDNLSEFQSNSKGSLTQISHTKKWQHESIKQKDLIGIPWSLAFALRNDGWYLRQDIIWHKPNPMPVSNPMSFWVNDDVLLYIKEKNLPICSVYGDIVEDLSGTDEVEGQMTISDLEGFEDMGKFDAKRPPLKTTGCFRTGCVLCAFGCLREKESRFLRLKETHPKVYKALDVLENNGVTYREAIEYINEHVKECEQILL